MSPGHGEGRPATNGTANHTTSPAKVSGVSVPPDPRLAPLFWAIIAAAALQLDALVSAL